MRTFIINFLIGLGIVRYFFELNPSIPINATNAVGAFFITYFILWLLSYFYDKVHFKKLPRVIQLFFFFVKELVKANLKIAYDVMTPTHHMSPGVIVYPMQASTDLEITMLANLLSLTPGSLVIDVSEDRKTLYFHSMYVPNNDVEKVKEGVRNGFEKKILAITR
jgi:multicomponent Na+:H+ antiporter subunit E